MKSQTMFFCLKQSYLLNLWCIILFLFHGSVSLAQSQVADLKGTVTNETGDPLAAASVTVSDAAGNSRSTITNDEGLFTLNQFQTGTRYDLLITAVGYQTYELKGYQVKPGDANNLAIRLITSTKSLEDVVVLGYGTQKAATITGSIATMKGEKLQASPAINLTNSLSGRIPGLVALTPSGEPGSDNSTLRIRGANTLGDNAPLIVVDGIPNRSIERLNPADIESVTVLKDASAAIYGARAANGVILVTTKKGSTGKPQVRFNYNEGRSKPTAIPRMADAATYAQLINEVLFYEGAAPQYPEEDIQKYRDGSDPINFPNTDWYGETFKSWATQRTADVSVSGGSENLRYFLSAGTRFQDAIYKNSATYLRQDNLRLNVDGKFSDHIKYGVAVALRDVNRNYPTESASQIFSKLRQSKPNTRAYWPNGLPADNGDAGNTLVISTNQTGYDKNKETVLETRGTLTVDVPWVKGLSFTGNAALDNSISNDKSWATPWYLYAWDGTTLGADGQPSLQRVQRGYTNAELTQNMQDARMITLNALANYQRNFGSDHHLKALVGMEKIAGESMEFMAFRKGFVSTAIDQLFAGGDADKNNSGTARNEARLNYFGRVNYDYKSRYLMEFVWRVDGSYIFPKESRFGFFPGVSLGWRVSKESFWKNLLPVVNDFKIRASWGKTGNDRITPYQFLSSYGFATGATNVYIFNNNQESRILNELRIPNRNVTWEVANQSNIGADLYLLDNKFFISAEYFYNLRTNILWTRNASVPATSGLTLPSENIGEVVNKGMEFQVGYNGQAGPVTYSLSANVSFNKNRIRFWDETPGVPDYQKSTGYSMNTSLFYNAIGIFADEAAVEKYPHWVGARAGDIIFEDVNADGKIDALDRVRVDKTNIPTQTGGFNADISYKGFFASVFFQWATGAFRNNYVEMQGQIGNYVMDDVEGRWTPENTGASKPRTWNRYNEYWRNNQNTYWLQNTDYLRLKNVQLGYNLPASVTRKISASAIQVYVSGLNLWTLTEVKGIDPETTSNTGYPQNKVFNFGVNVTF